MVGFHYLQQQYSQKWNKTISTRGFCADSPKLLQRSSCEGHIILPIHFCPYLVKRYAKFHCLASIYDYLFPGNVFMLWKTPYDSKYYTV